MDFNSNKSSSPSSSCSSSLEIITPHNQKLKKKAGRKTFKETRRHPECRGVRRKNGGKWVSEVRGPSPKTERGDHAPLNFPDSARRLHRPEASSGEDIQREALQDARDLNPSSLDSLCPCQNEGFVCDNEKGIRVLECEESGFLGFVDEEAIFNMPGLLDSMAEGMLLTPLAMKKGFNWSQEVFDDEIDLNLWATD